MQHYYQDMEGISEYVNTLKDAQKCSKRPGNLITEYILLLIATNAMLSMERLPWADESWEELPKNKTYWSAWEKLYKAADRKAKVKKQAVGGQDQSGAAHGALRQAPKIQEDQANDPTRSATDLNEYFDALAEAATT